MTQERGQLGCLAVGLRREPGLGVKRAGTGPHCIQKLQLKDTAVQAVFGPQHLKWRASLGIHTPSSHECAHVLMPGREPPALAHSPGCPALAPVSPGLCILFLYFPVAGLWSLLSECLNN